MECKFFAAISIALGLGATVAGPVAALDWHIEADDVHLGGVQIGRIEADRTVGELRVGPVRLTDGTALGEFVLHCDVVTDPACRRTRLDWQLPGAATGLEFALQLEPQRLRLDGPAMQLHLERLTPADAWQLQAEWTDLEALPALLPQMLGLSHLSGALTLTGELDSFGQTLQIELRNADFDTPDGRYAGAGLGLSLDGRRDADAITIAAEWRAGEALLGPAYLTAAAQPLRLTVSGTADPDCFLSIERFAVEQRSAVSIHGDGRIDPCHGLAGSQASLKLDRLDLAEAWTLGLESLAGAAGWAGLQPQGVISGALEWVEGQAVSGQFKLESAALADRDERLRIDGLGVELDWSDTGKALMLRLEWADALIHRVPLGPVELGVLGRDDVLRLSQPFSIPVLDGRILIESLEWTDWRSSERALSLAARLEPIGLASLTRSLGWTEFGGKLSGRIPGLRVVDGVIELDGGLQLELFDGRAQVRGLSIERPFGSLPALAADIEFEALDLALLTGAFEIGSMGGRVSGYLRELRLLDWQPVRFDAWFETLDTGRDRRISQKAVDSLSTLSGGGGAMLSGTLLQMFEDFPYRRIGLGCRLERNVCVMRGLEVVDSGGYMIIEGRPLPVLNVVGHRRRVDWPQLVAQLIALTES